MRPAVLRLIVTIGLFAGWLGYLGYLVVCRPHLPQGLLGAFEGRPLTLSQPQIMISTLDVVAEVNDSSGKGVVVKEILYPAAKAPLKVDDTIDVENIKHCHPVPDPMTKAEAPSDYTEAGRYILPLEILEVDGKRRFRVVPTPPSPGFPLDRAGDVGPPRIYPATKEMLAAYRQIAKAQ